MVRPSAFTINNSHRTATASVDMYLQRLFIGDVIND